MTLELGQVEVRTCPLRNQLLGIVKEEESEIEEGAGDGMPVHRDVLFVEVPAARPHHQRRRAQREGVALPLGARERDRAGQGVSQVDLPLEVVAPGGSVRILEVRHVDPRARVQRVDDHLAVDWARDLDPAVHQVRRNRRDGPGRLADAARLRQEVGPLAGVEPLLPFDASREQLLAARLEGARQLREELTRLVGEDVGEFGIERRVDFEAAGRHESQCSAPATDGIPGKEAGRAGMPRDHASRYPAAPSLQSGGGGPQRACTDRKSTRLNSSHVSISYAVFCLKKKKRYSVVRLLTKKKREIIK